MQVANDARIPASTTDAQLTCVLSQDGLVLSCERDYYSQLPVATKDGQLSVLKHV